MKDLLEICCGMDIHKDIIIACLLKGSTDNEPEIETREFSTLSFGLKNLKEWLESNDCKDIAMESTGVYWFPVYDVLEEIEDVNILVTNPKHMKNVPGKKTDINDARWIGTLLRAGLLNGSYIPEQEIRELRDLTRYRKTVVSEIASQKNRIEKFLQQCGIKLSSFVTDICGKSGMSIIKAFSERGSISENELINHLFGSVKKKLEDIKYVVDRKLNIHQIEFLKMLVGWFEKYQEHLLEVEEKMVAKAKQFQSVVELVCTIPCIEKTSATIIISEIGVNLDKFKTAGNLCSWAGLCPGNNESAGKRKSTNINKGNNFIKNVLCQCAWSIVRHKKSFLSSWYWKIKQRRGCKKAIIALARKLLTIIYNLITKNEIFDEDSYKNTLERQQEIRKNRLIYEARKLGLEFVGA